VNTGNQISIGGGAKSGGKFTFNDNNSISISGGGKRGIFNLSYLNVKIKKLN
jgi:hypothetical protein